MTCNLESNTLSLNIFLEEYKIKITSSIPSPLGVQGEYNSYRKMLFIIKLIWQFALKIIKIICLLFLKAVKFFQVDIMAVEIYPCLSSL